MNIELLILGILLILPYILWRLWRLYKKETKVKGDMTYTILCQSPVKEEPIEDEDRNPDYPSYGVEEAPDPSYYDEEDEEAEDDEDF